MLSATNSVRKAQPIRPIPELGVSVIGSAGFGWSGLSGRRTGDTGITGDRPPRPKPEKKNNTIQLIKCCDYIIQLYNRFNWNKEFGRKKLNSEQILRFFFYLNLENV